MERKKKEKITTQPMAMKLARRPRIIFDIAVDIIVDCGGLLCDLLAGATRCLFGRF